jgi:hypothetical protein
MGSNVGTHRAAHEAYNARDWDGAIRGLSPDFSYTDHAQGVTVKSAQEFQGWLRDWTASISNAQIADTTYYDAGDTTVCVFTGKGTNDGPIGPFPASGQRVTLPTCEIITWDSDGMAVSGEVFYDQMGLLVQTGHMEPPPTG